MYTYAVMRSPAGRSYLAATYQPTIDNLNNATPHSPKRPRRKAHRAPHIHRVPQHIEREALHPVVHQDPKVVAEEGAGDAERPGRGDEGCIVASSSLVEVEGLPRVSRLNTHTYQPRETCNQDMLTSAG